MFKTIFFSTIFGLVVLLWLMMEPVFRYYYAIVLLLIGLMFLISYIRSIKSKLKEQ